MRKLVASTTLAASLLGGGIGAVVLTPAIAAAQEESTAGATASSVGTVLEDLVTEGTLTQAQADAVEEALRTAHEEGRLGRGHGGKGHHRGPRAVVAVLEELGIDSETLRQGVLDGMTIGEIADANGSSAAAVVDALVEKMTERLDAAVEAGRLTADEAADKAAEFEARATEKVNSEIDLDRRTRARLNRFGADNSADTEQGDA